MVKPKPNAMKDMKPAADMKHGADMKPMAGMKPMADAKQPEADPKLGMAEDAHWRIDDVQRELASIKSLIEAHASSLDAITPLVLALIKAEVKCQVDAKNDQDKAEDAQLLTALNALAAKL